MKTSRCRVENQQTQPKYDAGSGNRTGAKLVGGDGSHHCAIPALRLQKKEGERRCYQSVFMRPGGNIATLDAYGNRFQSVLSRCGWEEK